MAFHALTGVPGHGKTSLMMEMLVEAADLNAKHVKSGKTQLVVTHQDGSTSDLIERPLYAAGIEGLVDGICNILEDPSAWRDLPDGSMVFVDEAWKWFGHMTDARGSKPPQHVLDVAEHRHFGMDFIITTQGPGQLYPFLRPLIAPHWHVVRRFNSALIDVYKWGELVEDVKSQGMRDRATKQTRFLPTKHRKLYRSASAHTMKVQVPKRLVLGVLAMLAVIPASWYAYKTARPDAIAAIGQGKAPEAGLPADGASPRSSRLAAADLSPEEYAAQFRQRILGVHGSQPIFDGRSAASLPATYCIIVGESIETKCSCYTEQVTPILDVTDLVCREWARHGRYDPFKAAPVVSSGVIQPSTFSPSPGGQHVPSRLGSGQPNIGENWKPLR